MFGVAPVVLHRISVEPPFNWGGTKTIIYQKTGTISKPYTLSPFQFQGFWGVLGPPGCEKKQKHALSFLEKLSYLLSHPPQKQKKRTRPEKNNMLMKLESFSNVFHFQVPTVTPSKF